MDARNPALDPASPPAQAALDERVRLRDLGLRLTGTALEPLVKKLQAELHAAGVRVQPRCYLSTEWGVSDEGAITAIGIPFYLARPELIRWHGERVGLIEGYGPSDTMRYLRHEMGHVVNYVYALHRRPEWRALFGDYGLPYQEEYVPQPFSSDSVCHLPGWYAQKHPDEDWAETFAVWLTPGLDWAREYAGCPGALAKLRYCDAVMAELRNVAPPPEDAAPDEDVAVVDKTLADLYALGDDPGIVAPPISGAALRSALGDLQPEAGEPALAVSELLLKRQRELVTNLFRATGHFPERTRPLLRQLAAAADALALRYRPDDELAALVALTSLLTALALRFICTGRYAP
jgi:hypothetical protein